MTVEELMAKCQNVRKDAKLLIVEEDELECMPDLWNDEEHKVGGTSGAIELYSEDCHSHEIYLLAINK